MQSLFKWYYFLATGFGLGELYNKNNFLPIGTLASAIAIPIWWIFMYFFSCKGYLFFLICSIIIGIYCCDKTNNIIGKNDHRSIVLDEFIGMWITLIFVPVYHFFWIIFAFVVFRIIDIVKPWPISWIDRIIKGGLGIILDDVLAGIISICVILYFMKVFY